MRLQIEKTATKIDIEITTDTAKKPMHVTLTPEQLRMAIGLLQMAANADTLTMELDI